MGRLVLQMGVSIDGFVAATGRRDLKPVLQRLCAYPHLLNRKLVDYVLK